MVTNKNPLLIRRRQIPTRDIVRSKYVRKSGAVVRGAGRRSPTIVSLRKRGGSRFAIPSGLSPGIVDNYSGWLGSPPAAKRRRAGGGDIVGYGIGNILSKGLKEVAKKVQKW